MAKLYELEEASIKKGNKRYVDGKIAAFQTQGGRGGGPRSVND